MKQVLSALAITMLSVILAHGQTQTSPPPIQFKFDGNLFSTDGDVQFKTNGDEIIYSEGINNKAITLDPENSYQSLALPNVPLDGSDDFTVQFWIKTTSKLPTVLLAQKNFKKKGITTQKNRGWVLYSYNGTFAFSIGSGDRRVTYERDNGQKMPINDGAWHQISLTYHKANSEFRIYYDGMNKAIYTANFEFNNNEPLIVGSESDQFDYQNQYLDEIETGAKNLQKMVDAFNDLDIENIDPQEFLDLITNPEKLYKSKCTNEEQLTNDEIRTQLKKVLAIRKHLGSNPYTVFQNRALTLLKPVSKLYSLEGDKVIINKEVATSFTLNEKLYPADFSIDELSIWKHILTPDEIWSQYNREARLAITELDQQVCSLNIGVWNIWHGGIHWTTEKDGWDSRQRIVEIIQKNNLDIVLMQETYSSGDFIAAELGYYFATTSDWDYCFQGANISVLSRYPIEEIYVAPKTEFNNVAVKVSISKTQQVYAMSNWYGMAQFPLVYNFNQARFDQSDTIPVFFGGDFNAVPHIDGGKSPASEKLLGAGFTDAFRKIYPNPKTHPGVSHRNGHRIDQLYYKGRDLKLESSKVVSDWPGGFPSDHYLLVNCFVL